MNKLEHDTNVKLIAFTDNLIQGHLKSNTFGLTNNFKVIFNDTMTSLQRKSNIPKVKKLTQEQFDELHDTTVKQILKFSDDMIKRKEKLKEFKLDNGFKVTFRDQKRTERK